MNNIENICENSKLLKIETYRNIENNNISKRIEHTRRNRKYRQVLNILKI